MPISDYNDIFDAAGKEWNVDPDLLRAMATQESGGKPGAVSKKGATGVMQIMPDTGRELGVTDLTDPAQSIYAGAKYMSQLLDKYKSPETALAAYNAGPGRIDDVLAGKAQMPDETRAYVPAIAAHYQKLTAPPAAPADTPYAIGDSIAAGAQKANGYDGAGVVGANPTAVLNSINQIPDGQLQGRSVVLSSGVSNDPSQIALVPQQIAALKSRGASEVRLLGVGDKFAGANDQLEAAAQQGGATYLGPLQTGPDGVHPANYQGIGSSPMPVPPIPPGAPGGGDETPAQFLARTTAPQEETPAAFLARTTGGAPQQEDVNAFLARTGGKVAPTPAPVAPADPVTDADGHVIVNGSDNLSATGDIIKKDAASVGRISSAALQGAKEGFGTEPLGLSPQSENALVNAGIYNGPNEYNPLKGINKAIINPLAAGADLVMRGGNALMGAYQHGISQAGTEIGAPQLGRDLAALPEAFPTGDTGGGLHVPAPAADVAATTERNALLARAAEDHTARLEAPLPDTFRDNPGVTAPSLPAGEAMPNPLVPQPKADQAPANALMAQPPDTAPSGPRSVGAAASSAQDSNMTPAEIQAYRSVAEAQKLNEAQPVGMDTNRYVPGVEPTVAHMEQNANTSREQKMLESAIPEDFKTVAKENNEARQQYFNQIAGSPVDVMNADAARSAQAERDITNAFGNKKATDATPVVDTIKEILTNPRDSENTAVQNYVKPLLDRLQDADGNLKSDPEQLYGLREDIARMQSKAAKAETPTLDHVSGQLQQIKDSLDQVIEKGAPGYRQYMDNYAAASRPIDAMQVLQGHENKLYDTQGRMQLSRVQNMMRNIVESRQAPGLNPYKSIPDETMQSLWNLRDDLRRVASADELAKARGSDTAQNMMDMAKGVGKMGAMGAAHAAANFVAPVAGSLVLNKLAHVAGAVSEVRAQKKMQKRAANMLHPDPVKYPPPNPLVN